MIYDTKWLKNHDKPMETVEDAICYVVGRLRCGDCPSCPVHLYHGGCSEHYEVKAKAIKLLAGVDINLSTDKKMYKSINAIEGKCRIGHDQTGTCATCNESFDHSPRCPLLQKLAQLYPRYRLLLSLRPCYHGR